MKKIKATSVLRYKNEFIVGFVVIALLLIMIFGREYFNFFNNREAFQEFIAGFGIFGPLVIIATIILEIIIAPIPGIIISLTAGFLFGPIEGAIYVYLGNIFGTILVFLFSRKFGRSVVERFIKKEQLIKYEEIIQKRENFLLFFYFFPILPIDIISTVFGLSKIKFKKFLTVVLIGYIPYAIFATNFGDYLAEIFFKF